MLQIVELPFAYYHGSSARASLRALHAIDAGIGFPIRRKGIGLGLVLAMLGTSVVYLAPCASWPDRLVVDLGGAVRGGDDWPGAARAGRAAADLLHVQAARSPGARRTPAGAGRRARAPTSVGVFEWVLSSHTKKANAALAGLGRTRRILLSDTLLADYSEDEIEVILAHELSHHVHHDLWRGIAVQALALFGGFYVASLLAAAVADPLALRGISDPAGLPVLLLVGGAVLVPADAGGQRAVARAGARRRPLCARDDTQC